MKKMNSKTFAFLLSASFFAALCLLGFCVGEAHKIWGLECDWKKGITNQNNALVGRQQKADYISQKNLSHNAFIIGGSKAGALRPEKLNFYTGLDFYNFYVSSGNFRDFNLFIDYILNHYDGEVKQILLHLSSHEAEMFSRISFAPIQMGKNPIAKLQSLFQYLKENFLNIDIFIGLYSLWNEKNPIGISSQTGERSQDDDDFIHESYQNDKIKFDKEVLSYWTNYDSALKKLFYEQVELPACKKNIQTLKKIKSKCEKKDVALKVVIGPTFIAELYKYASQEYIEYLKEIVSVCGSVWNFSGINDVNMNPYNFYNGGHCWLFTGDKMIEIMNRKNPNLDDLDAFGILLTSRNIDDYLASQKQKWQALKSEYDKTKTVSLKSKDDKSYLGK